MNFNFPWLTKIPNAGRVLFAVNFQIESEISIDFFCYWSDSKPGANLLLVVKGDELSQEEAGRLGFVSSEYGFYKYVKPHIQEEKVCMTFKASPSVREVWLVPFCTQSPVYIQGLNVISSDLTNVNVNLPSSISKEGAIAVPSGSVAINANLLKFNCGHECCVHFNKWFDSMDGFASRWGDHLGRDSFLLTNGRKSFPAVLHRGRPALLRIPSDISEWLYEIGDKSRNMISKARRLGYFFKDVDPSEVGQDIYEVRTSDPMRQGRGIPEYFHTNPPKFVIDRSKVGCHHHDELFIGVFFGEKLVSYITLFVFGQLAEINHILCHDDHLNNGVMNFNLYCAVSYLVDNRKEVKYLNYLYVSESKNSGVDLFKRSMGFKSRQIFIYDGVEDLQGFDVPVLQPKVKERKVKDDVKDSSKKYRHDNSAVVVMGDISSNVEVSDKLNIDGSSIVFVEAPDLSNFVKFWSSEVRILAQSFSIGTFIAIDFPKETPLSDEYGVSNYLLKRFKASPSVDIGGLRCGFKGGSFRLAGFFNRSPACVGTNSLLVLEKISE